MAPLVLALQQRSDRFETSVVVTGQHRQMLDQVLDVFAIKPNVDLDIMGHNQSLSQITVKILERLAPVFETEQPDMILVHGDTTTTFAASLAAFYHHIPIGHVEAGLRTWKKYSPYPEEMNRQLTDVLADLYFAPTDLAKENLLKEGRQSDLIFITGNTAIDALRYTVNQEFNHPILETVDPQKKLIVVTMHRRENQGEPMRQVFHTLKDLALKHQEIEIVYPVHLSPQVQELAKEVLGNSDRIHLIPPLEVTEFHNLLAKAYLVLTDSGGIQEEAPSLGKPVLVLRDTTERPEGVEAGTLKLVGTETATIERELAQLLTDQDHYQKMAEAKNPYGDGYASEKIIDALIGYFDSK